MDRAHSAFMLTRPKRQCQRSAQSANSRLCTAATEEATRIVDRLAAH